MPKTVVDGSKQAIVDMACKDNIHVAYAVIIGIMLLYLFDTQAVGILRCGMSSQWMVGSEKIFIEKPSCHIGTLLLRSQDFLTSFVTIDVEFALGKCRSMDKLVKHRQKVAQMTTEGIEGA